MFGEPEAHSRPRFGPFPVHSGPLELEHRPAHWTRITVFAFDQSRSSW
jgi:hypothetical protein